MSGLFKHPWAGSTAATVLAGLLMLLYSGEIDLRILPIVFVAALILFSFPSIGERFWQSRHLPYGTVHVPIGKIRSGTDISIQKLFEIPEIFASIKNRYALKLTDPSAAGIFFYVYLPSSLYEMRNAGPEAIYRRLATRLKEELQDSQDLDLIAQRALPLTLGFRFLPKNTHPYHALSKVIDIVKKDYYRENTRIRGILQSKRRLFRIHTPDDNEWHTFQPYHEDTQLLSGGVALAHDFRSNEPVRIDVARTSRIGAERVEYPEKIAFGSLLTYAKKGEIALQGVPMAVDKLYIDRVNILVNGSEHRKEILVSLGKILKREITEEDIYPLFNYGQKLQSYMEPGKTVSDYVSSRGNFALHYDTERGWIVIPLSPGLELRIVEAYWNQSPQPVKDPTSLTTSRATLISGSADSLLNFEISTGTPTRGQIFAADKMIESKIQSFSQIFGFHLLHSVGTGAEGCLYLAQKGSERFYLKSPDGQLAKEEIETIQHLKDAGLIPARIQTYTEDRMIVLPEFQSANNNGMASVMDALIFRYLHKTWEAGFICLDLTPEHVKIDPVEKKIFLIDFAGYAKISDFKKHAKEFMADRKKIEYRTPEEVVKDYRDVEKLQIYLLGLLFYQIRHRDHGLPFALKNIDGASEYEKQLSSDLNGVSAEAPYLKEMLAYDPMQRKSFQQLEPVLKPDEQQVQNFWKGLKIG